MTENFKNKKYLLKISLIWFALTLVAYLLRGLISSEKLLKGLCIETTVVFALVFYHLWKWKGTPFKVVTLFVLMCFLYLQGQVLLDTFDLTKDGLLSGKFSPRGNSGRSRISFPAPDGDKLRKRTKKKIF